MFISNKQKGLINAMKDYLPYVEHRMCARHIYANWRKKYREKDWQKLFWACAKAPCTMLFTLARAKLAQCTPDGAREVMNTDPQHWSRAWFRLGSCCDSVDNNISETFNKQIKDLKGLNLCELLDSIRELIMVKFNVRRHVGRYLAGIILPEVLKRLNALSKTIGPHKVAWNTEHEAEITLYDVKAYDQRHTVDLQQRTCSCRVYQVSGNPCIHALTQWEPANLGFPVYPPVQEKRPPGRPRVQRIRGFLEDPGRKVVKCKKCGRNGHFANTCNLPPLVIAEPPPMEHTPTKRCHCTYNICLRQMGSCC